MMRAKLIAGVCAVGVGAGLLATTAVGAAPSGEEVEVATASAISIEPLGTVDLSEISARVVAPTSSSWSPIDERELEIIHERKELEEKVEHGLKPGRAEAAHTPPAVAGSPVVEATAGASGFAGLNHTDHRMANGGKQFNTEPPDTTMCGGNGALLEMVNTAMRVRGPWGANRSNVVDLNTFFGFPAAFDRAAGLVGPSTGDPKCYFDHESGRWFILSFALDYAPTIGNDLGVFGGKPTNRLFLALAVSRTGDPMGAYDRYLVDLTNDGKRGTVKHPGCPCLPDQPLIGTDKYGFYISYNEFVYRDGNAADFGEFHGAQIAAFSKQALLGHTTLWGVLFENLGFGADKPGYSWQPAQVTRPGDYVTANNGTMYFLGAAAYDDDFLYGHDVVLATMTNTKSLLSSGRPRLKASMLPSHPYATPEPVAQKDGPTPLRRCLATAGSPCALAFGATFNNKLSEIQTNDERMSGAVLVGGKVYGAQNTKALVGGKVSTAISWYEVVPSATGGSVSRQGYLAARRAAVNMPHIMATGSGEIYLGYSVIGGERYPSAAYSRIGDDVVRVVGLGAAPLEGLGYMPFGSVQEPLRFGDYSGYALLDGRLYLNEQWVQGATATIGPPSNFANWGTYVMQIPLS